MFPEHVQSPIDKLSVTPSGHLFGNLIRFGRLLRDIGLNVPAGGMLKVSGALAHVDIGHRLDFYHTLQTLLVHNPQDLPLFNAAFVAFWREPRARHSSREVRSSREQQRNPPPTVNPPHNESPSHQPDSESNSSLRVEEIAALSYSARRVSRVKDFASFTDAEVAEARDMIATLEWRLGTRVTRRWHAGGGRTIDIRRAVRYNLRFGGELMELPRRRRRHRPRSLVLLCDVSGSMERYSRMLLHFVHALAGGFKQVETFVFSTTLTRITRRLAKRGVDDVVPTLPRHVPDWSGGTRIGEALGQFNVDWARRVMGHSPVVLLISDGWDRGDPARLTTEMARVQRSCHRLIWLNPLLGSPRYRPLTKGMQAALAWVDDFLPVHNLASLDALAVHLSRLPHHRSVRRQPGLRAATALTARGETLSKTSN